MTKLPAKIPPRSTSAKRQRKRKPKPRPKRPRQRQRSQSRRTSIRTLALSGLAIGTGFAIMNREKMASLVKSTRSLRFELEDWFQLGPARRVLPNSDKYAAFLNSLKLRHITAEEIIRPHRNIQKGVANHLPPEYMWKRLAPTLKIADQIRHDLGTELVCINSAYRSPEYNAICSGAASRSYHMKNCALDLVFACGPEKAAASASKLRDAGAFRGGIGTYSGFIHIDTRGHNATWTT